MHLFTKEFLNVPIEKIISGGQTGVDQAALRFAVEKRMKVGGWCPPGRVCEGGVIPPEFPLQETEQERSPDAPDIPRSLRTERNVRDADATLILWPASLKKDPGTEWTIQCAQKLGKPFMVVDPYSLEAKKIIADWILKNSSIKVLNIAGPSENACPGIYNQTLELLESLFAPI
ncbi:MAG: putative molybdenum carrier protein [Flavobacteriales bacterium]|nr:putative molybdenum carrier protein [Flavobacteriales bacterium]MDW8410918.1 putative molybdenum carrier protein [Flavobacteriales bacterium]